MSTAVNKLIGVAVRATAREGAWRALCGVLAEGVSAHSVRVVSYVFANEAIPRLIADGISRAVEAAAAAAQTFSIATYHSVVHAEEGAPALRMADVIPEMQARDASCEYSMHDAAGLLAVSESAAKTLFQGIEGRELLHVAGRLARRFRGSPNSLSCQR